MWLVITKVVWETGYQLAKNVGKESPVHEMWRVIAGTDVPTNTMVQNFPWKVYSYLPGFEIPWFSGTRVYQRHPSGSIQSLMNPRLLHVLFETAFSFKAFNQNVTYVFQFLQWLERARVAQSVQRLGCGVDDRGSITGRGSEFFSSLPHPDRFWGPPRLLSNGLQRQFRRR
jgi:hypothetical protein